MHVKLLKVRTPAKHPNCRCVVLERESKVNEDGCKFQAQMMMLGLGKEIVIPTREEWIGFNLLERDDGLERKS